MTVMTKNKSSNNSSETLKNLYNLPKVKANNISNKSKTLPIKINNSKLNYKKSPHPNSSQLTILSVLKMFNLQTIMTNYLKLKNKINNFNNKIKYFSKNLIRDLQNCNKNLKNYKNFKPNSVLNTKQELKH